MLTSRLSSVILLSLAFDLLVVPPAAAPPTRRVIKRAPAVTIYAYENTEGETVEEWENLQGKIEHRRFYRPAPPACAYVRRVGLETDCYWRAESEQLFNCSSPKKELVPSQTPTASALRTISPTMWRARLRASTRWNSNPTSTSATRPSRPIKNSCAQRRYSPSRPSTRPCPRWRSGPSSPVRPGRARSRMPQSLFPATTG